MELINITLYNALTKYTLIDNICIICVSSQPAGHNTNFASGLDATPLRTTINLVEVMDSAQRHSLKTHISNPGSAPVFKYNRKRGNQLR